jgi:hypothetical protein
VRIPTAAPEPSIEDAPPPRAPASASHNAFASNTPGYAELLEDEMDQARARSRSGSSTRSRLGPSSSAVRNSNKKTVPTRREQVKVRKKVSRDTLERLSRTPNRLKRDKASKRPAHIETAFGRTYDKDDRYALNPSLTPHTYDFASHLRNSGKKKKKTKGETARGILGGHTSSSLERSAQRRAPPEKTNATPGKSTLKTRGIPSKRNASSMSRMRARNPPVGPDRGGGGPTPGNTPNIPRVRVSLPEAKPLAQQDVAAEDGGEEEWNGILRSLIDQKRKSLALLYRSLSNETESQSRLVNSQNPGSGAADVIQSIHIDRQGAVSYNNN